MSLQSHTRAHVAPTPDVKGTERAGGVNPRLVDAALLALLVVAAACFYMVYALRIGSFQPDEWYYMELARYIAGHFPSGLWAEGIYWRGIQRLDQLVLAAPFAFLRGASVYEVAHGIQAFLFASTAIPVWLLARGSGLRRWACMLASTIALAIPWAIVSTSFLAESAAYPAYAWVLWSTWWTMRRPSRARELLAIVALIVAAFSRTALLAMAPILPVALLWQQWRWELRNLRWGARLRALPGALWSQYPIVTAVSALALAAFLLSIVGLVPGGGVAALTGNYGLPQQTALSGLLSRYDYYLSRVIVGTGGIATVLGLSWALRTIVRPRDGAVHALSVVAVLGVGVMLLSLLQAGPDERYILYGAVPVGLAFAAELDSRWTRARAAQRLRASGGVLSAVVAAAAVIVVFNAATWPPATGEYEFFTYPAATFYSRIALTRLASLPGPLTPLTVVDLVIAALTLGWLLAGRSRRLMRPAAALMAILVLGVCATELVYSLNKFTATPAATADGTSAAARSWLERVLPKGANASAVGIGLGQSAEYVSIWRTSEFWNTAIQSGFSFQPWGVPTLPFGDLSLMVTAHGPSGRLTADLPTPAAPKEPMPRYLLLPRQATNPFGFVDKLVANDPLLPLSLVHLTGPPRLEWAINDISIEGFMAPGQAASATVFEGGLTDGPRCASFALVAPATYYGPTFSGSWPYLVRSGPRELVRGRLRGGQTRPIGVRLYPTRVPGGVLASITIHVDGEVRYVNKTLVSARIVNFAVGACRHAG